MSKFLFLRYQFKLVLALANIKYVLIILFYYVGKALEEPLQTTVLNNSQYTSTLQVNSYSSDVEDEVHFCNSLYVIQLLNAL